jgi:hypothetical protein
VHVAVVNDELATDKEVRSVIGEGAEAVPPVYWWLKESLELVRVVESFVSDSDFTHMRGFNRLIKAFRVHIVVVVTSVLLTQ